MKKGFVVLLLSVLPLVAMANAVPTISQPVTQINYNGNSEVLFFVGGQKWGASGCLNATYVQVKSDVAGQHSILSIGLAAKMAGKNVMFIGNCDADPDYFDATYIIIQ